MERICLKCIFAGVLAQACFAAEVEPRLDVVFDDANGGVKSVTVAGDQDAMNWVEGLGEWGTPSPSMRLDFVSAKTSGSVQTAINEKNDYFKEMDYMMDKSIEKEFITQDCKDLYMMSNNIDEVLDYIENYDEKDIDLSKVKIR